MTIKPPDHEVSIDGDMDRDIPMPPPADPARLESLIAKLKGMGLLPDGSPSGNVSQRAFGKPSRHDDDSEAVLRILDQLRSLRLDAALAAYLRQIRRAETFSNDFEARLFDLLSRQEAYELPKPRLEPQFAIAAKAEHSFSPDPLLKLCERLSLHGVSHALLAQRQDGHAESMSFDERFAALLDREVNVRRPLVARRKAGIPYSASIMSFSDPARRGLEDADVDRLRRFNWADDIDTFWISGKPHSGRSWLASALACDALTHGLSVVYTSADSLQDRARSAAGKTADLGAIRAHQKSDVLVIDDLDVDSDRHAAAWDVYKNRLRTAVTVVVTRDVTEQEVPIRELRELLAQALPLHLLEKFIETK